MVITVFQILIKTLSFTCDKSKPYTIDELETMPGVEAVVYGLILILAVAGI